MNDNIVTNVDKRCQPIKVKAVVVVFFHIDNGVDEPEGEFKHWISRYNLKHRIPFPQGDHDLRINEDNVIGFAAGIGATTAAAAVMGLGMDPRFDLSKAYWLIAGVAGANPAMMTVGSVAWARFIVDIDKKHMLDPGKCRRIGNLASHPMAIQ